MAKYVTSAPIYREARIFRITWGQPQMILIAKMDRRCPRCNSHPIYCKCRSCRIDEMFAPRYLDLGYNGNGKIFGGKCNKCGWSFLLNAEAISEEES